MPASLERLGDVLGGVAVLGEDQHLLAGVLVAQQVDQGVDLGVTGGVPVTEAVQELGDRVVVLGQVLAQRGLEHCGVDPLGLGRQATSLSVFVAGGDAAVQVARLLRGPRR